METIDKTPNVVQEKKNSTIASSLLRFVVNVIIIRERNSMMQFVVQTDRQLRIKRFVHLFTAYSRVYRSFS